MLHVHNVDHYGIYSNADHSNCVIVIIFSQISQGKHPSLLILYLRVQVPSVPFKLSSNISKVLCCTITLFLQTQEGLRVGSITLLQFSLFPKKKEQFKDKILITRHYPKKEISIYLWHYGSCIPYLHLCTDLNLGPASNSMFIYVLTFFLVSSNLSALTLFHPDLLLSFFLKKIFY